MAQFENLRIPDGAPFSLDKWETLIDCLEALNLTIPTNKNGEIINEVTIGTSPSDGTEINYPWDYETVGVSKPIYNLRLQSPQSVFVHTNINQDESANQGKIPLTIHSNSHVGIGLHYPEPPQGRLQIINENQDANGNTLVLGKIDDVTSNLRLGYHKDYSWIQSHGRKPLLINPKGNNNENKVGIGTTNPQSPLHVAGTIQSSAGGFKFPNGSVQTKAVRETVIRSGNVAMNNTGGWRTSPLATGDKKHTLSIGYSGFSVKPTVFYSIYSLDNKGSENTRLTVTIKNVSKTGFKIDFRTWNKSEVYGCHVRWLAIGF